ncbi:Cell divisionFtsK/SpoIIIE protein [Enterococcus faecium DO]|nr:Cell divisionFtsK/SpoIIIE protein [Enterococcus faecium DO]
MASPNRARARVVGEPEFQQAAQAAQVAIDAGQLADVLIVHDARDFVALADGQQVGRQAHAGRRRLFLNRSSFVWKAVHLDRWAALPGWLGFISHPLALICYAGGSRPASQSRIPVEHRQVRIRDSEEGTPARGWAYFTYPARLTPLDTPRKVYTNPLAKSCISCEKGWIYRKNRYNDPEAGCSWADLADLGSVMANVYYRKEDLLSCIETFYEEMMKRSEEMKQMKNYKTGKNYAYLGLPAHFLIFDEYVAFMEMLGTKENTAVMNKLKQIVMLGRQAGFFLILACQRPDAKYLGDGIRDQFNFRVALGRMSEMGYGMMFGSDVQKDFFLKRIKGRGYVDVGTSVISEFYTPLVPKGYDFLEEIKKLSNSRQSTQATCEAEVAGVD